MASLSSPGAVLSHEEILALFRIWSDCSVQESFKSNTRRNVETYRKITEELNNLGYTRKQVQINAKLKNLKQFYKHVKCGHEKSGYNRDNWPYFDLIDAVLGDRPSTMPVYVIDTTEPPQDDQISEGEHLEDDESVSGATTANSSSTHMDNEEEDDDDDVDGVESEVAGTSGCINSASTQRCRSHQPTATTPASKRSKNTGIERALSSFTDAFLQHQFEKKERMMQNGEKRRKKELKPIEKVRKDEREHEMRLFQLLGQLMSPPPPPMHPATYSYIPPPHPLENIPPLPVPFSEHAVPFYTNYFSTQYTII